MKFIFLAVLFAYGFLQGCTNVMPLEAIPHSGPSVETTVVDGLTGKPLAGAMVVIAWNDYTRGVSLMHGFTDDSVPLCNGTVKLESAISDADGHVAFPAWSQTGACLKLSPYSPTAVIYKPGYGLLVLQTGPVVLSDAISDMDDREVKLIPLPHHFDGEKDAQVSNFLLFGGSLRSLTTDFRAGNCFWDQLRPAVLMLMQEKRRLSGYIYPQETFFEDFTSSGTSAIESTCGDLRPKLQPLIAEAAFTQPEGVLDPTLWHVSGATTFFAPAATPSPPYAADPDVEKRFGQTSVIYRFQFDPLNVGYVRASVQKPPERAVLLPTGGQYAYQPAADFRSRNFDYDCGSPVATTVQSMLDPGTRAPKPVDPPPAVHTTCRWLVAYKVTTDGANPQWSDPVYDLRKHEWELNPSMLYRFNVSVPEYVEIDGPETLTVTTDMQQVAPRLWRLPAGTFASYSMTIKSTQANPAQ
jgi:hypothetical protein